MFTIGSDPEFFLRDSQNHLVPSFGLLGGTKTNPIATKHGFIQEDNVTAEVNSRPSSSLLEFINNHRLIIQDLEDILEPLKLRIDISGSALFPDELLSHPLAMIAGCEPDFSAWSMTRNKPVSYQTTNLRAAGGHLHIAFDKAKDSPMNSIAFCKAMDLELGLPSIILDTDQERRKLYGKAGAHRLKMTTPHPDEHGNSITDAFDGFEYRVLSNFWLKSDKLLKFVYEKVQFIDDNLKELSEKAESIADELVYTINEGSPEDAMILCESMEVRYAA